MENSPLNWIANSIQGIADDVLSDICVSGKCRDIIFSTTVVRRLDAVLEPTKDAILTMKGKLDATGVVDQWAALCRASGQSLFITSPFRLRDLRARTKQHRLKADSEVFSSREFDFMLSPPPYGKNWKSDLEPNVTGRVE